MKLELGDNDTANFFKLREQFPDYKLFDNNLDNGENLTMYRDITLGATYPISWWAASVGAACEKPSYINNMFLKNTVRNEAGIYGF